MSSDFSHLQNFQKELIKTCETKIKTPSINENELFSFPNDLKKPKMHYQVSDLSDSLSKSELQFLHSVTATRTQIGTLQIKCYFARVACDRVLIHCDVTITPRSLFPPEPEKKRKIN